MLAVVTSAPALRWSITIAPLMMRFLKPVTEVTNSPVVLVVGVVMPVVPFSVMVMV
jgi:hypothetical protein